MFDPTFFWLTIWFLLKAWLKTWLFRISTSQACSKQVKICKDTSSQLKAGSINLNKLRLIEPALSQAWRQKRFELDESLNYPAQILIYLAQILAQIPGFEPGFEQDSLVESGLKQICLQHNCKKDFSST
jgi:hypothetical protein